MTVVNNFAVKQISSKWRVIGPGGKVLPDVYRNRQSALVGMKEAVDRFSETHNFGFVKELSLQIEDELKKLETKKIEEEQFKKDVEMALMYAKKGKPKGGKGGKGC